MKTIVTDCRPKDFFKFKAGQIYSNIDESIIVMCSQTGNKLCGTVVAIIGEPDCVVFIGEYYEGWNCNHFSPFTGKIELISE